MPTLAQFAGPFVDWSWVSSHADEIVAATIEHLLLTGIAIGIGFVLSLPLSVLAVRWRVTYAPITWVTAILFTIPSLALFAILVPITGLTILTAEIGLVSYTLLILIENIVTGIDGVPPSVVESARGMGYGSMKIFRTIQLPLALPAIIAGLRIATVTIVGLVTVTAVIGYGGLGKFILQGLRTFRYNEIIVGAVLSIALAVVLDVALLALERALTPWSRRRRAAA